MVDGLCQRIIGESVLQEIFSSVARCFSCKWEKAHVGVGIR